MAEEQQQAPEEEGGYQLPGWAQGIQTWVMAHKPQAAFLAIGAVLAVWLFSGGSGQQAVAPPPPSEQRDEADARFGVDDSDFGSNLGILEALQRMETDMEALRLGMEQGNRMRPRMQQRLNAINTRVDEMRGTLVAELEPLLARRLENLMTGMIEEAFADMLKQTLTAVEEERQRQMVEIPEVNPLQILYPRGGAGDDAPGAAALPTESVPVAGAPPPPPPPEWARLPAGSVVSGRLLTGTFATALDGGGMPVLVGLEAPFAGPNGLRVDLSGCVVLGNASADMRAIRVQVQVRSLSCWLPGGDVFEAGINGYLAGDDAVSGVPGTFEKRNGKWLGDLAASMGVAAASALADVQIAESIGGTVLTGLPSISQTMGARMQDFFLQRAEEVVPAIRVPSDEQVYVVLLQGVTIEGLAAEGGAAADVAFGSGVGVSSVMD